MKITKLLLLLIIPALLLQVSEAASLGPTAGSDADAPIESIVGAATQTSGVGDYTTIGVALVAIIIVGGLIYYFSKRSRENYY